MNWTAWRDHQPRPGPVVRVQAECTFPTPGFTVELRRPGSRVAQVRGPAIVSRAGPPPAFQVAAAPGRFFALEVTTDITFFEQTNPAGWTPDRTHATWQDGPLLAGSSVALPLEAWNRLKNADCLFYRIRTSSRQDGWSDVECTPPPSEARSSPVVAVVAALTGLTDPDRLVLFRLAFPPSGGSVGDSTTVRATYVERTDEAFSRVTILPDRTTVEFEDVF